MASRDELYAKFGITAEAAQLFETEIGTLLLSIKGEQQEWHINSERTLAEEFLIKIDKSTLGKLLAQMQKLMDAESPITIDDGMKELFESALRARNRLFHGFYLRHNFKIQTDIGRDEMISELEIMHTELFNAWQIASGLSEIYQVFLEHEKASHT